MPWAAAQTRFSRSRPWAAAQTRLKARSRSGLKNPSFFNCALSLVGMDLFQVSQLSPQNAAA